MGVDNVRKFMAFLCILSLVAAMILTNPGMNTYVNWFERNIIPKSQGSLVATIGERVRKPVIESSTMVKKYVFLSHYTTVIGSQQVMAVGILNGFFSNVLDLIGISTGLAFVFMVLMMMMIL